MLAERGATVVAVDSDGEAIEKVTATTGGLAIAVDIRDPRRGDAVIARVLDAAGAWMLWSRTPEWGTSGDFATMPPEDVTSLVEVNFRGPLLLTRAALPSMTERGSGALVFTTSIAGGVRMRRPRRRSASRSQRSRRSPMHCARTATNQRDRDNSPTRSGTTAFHDDRNKPYWPKIPQPVEPEAIAAAIIDGIETGKSRRTVPLNSDRSNRSAAHASCLRGHVPPLGGHQPDRGAGARQSTRSMRKA